MPSYEPKISNVDTKSMGVRPFEEVYTRECQDQM